MSFPRFVRRLFANEGAGPKLREDILPEKMPGTAASATKLETARTIFGMSFDGTANVTHYASCATAAGTAAKAVTLAGFKLAAGAEVLVSFTTTNSVTNPTLNVQNTGAKPIRFANLAIGAGVPVAGRLYHLVYDGTAWQIVGDVFTPALTAQIERAEFLNKLSIGAPKFHRSTVLPDDHAWPDGSLVLFEDWPEFFEVYKSGGFEGMLLPWDASAATQAANLGKYRPNAANPTGLYLPLHGGQFFRAWVLGGDGSAGGYNAPGLPNVQGYALIHTVKGAGAGGALSFGNFEINQLHTGGADWGGVWLNIDASHSNVIYGASPTVMPPSINIPVIIYLGRPK
ncbi:hypothetical protein [uncultured Desulfovibrio sp.]|uniref:hypothetical protein n=1 Tax=uncultured Desulfovibrio sp. TaxID=167968 RepID=UPI002591730B|nr:hypothetical protein [uncultured Desulfovibrio sp.]